MKFSDGIVNLNVILWQLFIHEIFQRSLPFVEQIDRSYPVALAEEYLRGGIFISVKDSVTDNYKRSLSHSFFPFCFWGMCRMYLVVLESLFEENVFFFLGLSSLWLLHEAENILGFFLFYFPSCVLYRNGCWYIGVRVEQASLYCH